MATEKDLLVRAVRSALEQLAKRSPAKYKMALSALQTDKAISQLTMEFDWDDVDSRQRLLEGAFLRAVESFPEDELKAWFGGKRPCCSAYPATWPFCNPKC